MEERDDLQLNPDEQQMEDVLETLEHSEFAEKTPNWNRKCPC